jgi:signal transduction histidine kinase
LEAANQELRTAQEELVKREKLAVLGQLTATVSHELRNPLGVIKSSNYYLHGKFEGPNPKVEKHFKRIDEQVSQCNSIVEQLLEYTRSKGLTVKKAFLAPLMESVVEQMGETYGIETSLRLQADLEPIDHDLEKMERVMVNLLTNAVLAVRARADGAAEKGHTYKPEIRIEVSQKVNAQIVVVADNGVGMSEDVRRRAFEPLFTTRAQGTGIGLANVKKIIEEHAGSIVLESTVDQGTQVTLILPMVQ